MGSFTTGGAHGNTRGSDWVFYVYGKAHMCFVLRANHNLLVHGIEPLSTSMPWLRLCFLRKATAIFRSSSRWNHAG